MVEHIPDQIIDHLEEALATDEVEQKDFHIRQAEQLVVRLNSEDCSTAP